MNLCDSDTENVNPSPEFQNSPGKWKEQFSLYHQKYIRQFQCFSVTETVTVKMRSEMSKPVVDKMKECAPASVGLYCLPSR
jgi:hypothetical protein